LGTAKSNSKEFGLGIFAIYPNPATDFISASFQRILIKEYYFILSRKKSFEKELNPISARSVR
jgi:hypothetical protein